MIKSYFFTAIMLQCLTINDLSKMQVWWSSIGGTIFNFQSSSKFYWRWKVSTDPESMNCPINKQNTKT